MASLDDVIKRIEDFLSGKTQIRDKIALDAADLAVKLVRSRITATGQTATFDKFSPYSKSYAIRKFKAGKNVSYKDFLFTGSFWDSIKAKIISSDPARTVVEMTPSPGANTRKYRELSTYEGRDILELSLIEQSIVYDYIADQYFKKLGDVFNG